MEDKDDTPLDASIIIAMRKANNLAVDPYLLRCVEYSVKSSNYQIFTDKEGEPCGYIIWANVNRETIHKILRFGKYPRFFYEWNEGGISLLIDVFNKTQNSPYLLTQIKKILHKKRIFFYGSENKFKLMVKNRKIFYMYPLDKFKTSFNS